MTAQGNWTQVYVTDLSISAMFKRNRKDAMFYFAQSSALLRTLIFLAEAASTSEVPKSGSVYHTTFTLSRRKLRC